MFLAMDQARTHARARSGRFGGWNRRSSAMFVTIFAAFLGIAVVTGPVAQAQRKWMRVEVPGAKCGDGSEYSMYVSLKDPKRIAVTLMGGGACWSKETCFGPTPTAWVHKIPGVIEQSGWVSDDAEQSPVSNHSMIYLPYCTGDVHVGDHIAQYDGNPVYHWGKRNFDAAMQYLGSTGLADLHGADQVVFYGYSAGAIGAFLHSVRMDGFLRAGQDKVLVSDAPGLHFGDKFWDKFTEKEMADFTTAMATIGQVISPGEGNMAALVPSVCNRLPDWRVAVLQGTRDVVMSLIYGDITPKNERRMILGKEGLWDLITRTNTPANCTAWIPDTAMHTFMIDSVPAEIKAGKETALSFVSRAVTNHDFGQSYRD